MGRTRWRRPAFAVRRLSRKARTVAREGYRLRRALPLRSGSRGATVPSAQRGGGLGPKAVEFELILWQKPEVHMPVGAVGNRLGGDARSGCLTGGPERAHFYRVGLLGSRPPCACGWQVP